MKDTLNFYIYGPQYIKNMEKVIDQVIAEHKLSRHVLWHTLTVDDEVFQPKREKCIADIKYYILRNISEAIHTRQYKTLKDVKDDWNKPIIVSTNDSTMLLPGILETAFRLEFNPLMVYASLEKNSALAKEYHRDENGKVHKTVYRFKYIHKPGDRGFIIVYLSPLIIAQSVAIPSFRRTWSTDLP